MDVLNPKAVAITASRAGTYGAAPSLEPIKERQNNLNAAGGHPAAEAINRIYQIPNISSNLNVYWNAINGRMKFSTKGSDSFTFEGSEALRGYYDLSVTKNVPVWNDELGDFENKVKNEEDFKLHETKVFEFRNYAQYLPTWAKEGQFVV